MSKPVSIFASLLLLASWLALSSTAHAEETVVPPKEGSEAIPVSKEAAPTPAPAVEKPKPPGEGQFETWEPEAKPTEATPPEAKPTEATPPPASKGKFESWEPEAKPADEVKTTEKAPVEPLAAPETIKTDAVEKAVTPAPKSTEPPKAEPPAGTIPPTTPVPPPAPGTAEVGTEKKQEAKTEPKTEPKAETKLASKPEKKTKKAEKAKVPFIKGDLVYPGTRRLLSRYDHVGISMGVSFIDGDIYAVLSPGMAWYLDSGLAVSLHMPLNLLALDVQGDDFAFGGLKVRKQDWDEVSDFAKVIRFISFGRKEAKFYLTINTMRPSTIGHGTLMNGYQGDIDVDRSLTGLIFDAYNDYGGFQLQINDITFQNRILGGLIFVKPLSLFSDDVSARSLSLGIEYLADTKAPRCVRLSVNSNDCVQGTGHAAGFHPFSGESLDGSFVRTDPDTGRFAVKETMVHALGTSIEYKFLKGQAADLKVYGTFHKYLNDGGGSGATAGMLARINLGQPWINAFRLRSEYRAFDDGFLPAYFNTLYEIQKYAYLYSAKDYQVGPTKYQQVFGDPENGFERQNNGWRHGFNLDLSWGLFKNKRSGKQVSLGVGLQESTGPNDTHFYAHLEFPMFGWLQIFGTYLRPNAANISEALSDRQDSVILTGLRLQILPVLFLNAHYAYTFRAVASPGSELHLGNDSIVDSSGNSSPFFVQDDLFEHVHSIYAELEFGWEFSDD